MTVAAAPVTVVMGPVVAVVGGGEGCRGANGRVAVTVAAAPVAVWPSRLLFPDLFLRFRLKKITFK